jgi:hypothetical protein
MGYFLCRSPISVDLLMQPPPIVASGETETSTPDLSCNKRVRREDAALIGETLSVKHHFEA